MVKSDALKTCSDTTERQQTIANEILFSIT